MRPLGRSWWQILAPLIVIYDRLSKCRSWQVWDNPRSTSATVHQIQRSCIRTPLTKRWKRCAVKWHWRCWKKPCSRSEAQKKKRILRILSRRMASAMLKIRKDKDKDDDVVFCAMLRTNTTEGSLTNCTGLKKMIPKMNINFWQAMLETN